jgi:hypothetical protein
MDLPLRSRPAASLGGAGGARPPLLTRLHWSLRGRDRGVSPGRTADAPPGMEVRVLRERRHRTRLVSGVAVRRLQEALPAPDHRRPRTGSCGDGHRRSRRGQPGGEDAVALHFDVTSGDVALHRAFRPVRGSSFCSRRHCQVPSPTTSAGTASSTTPSFGSCSPAAVSAWRAFVC